jgi:rod shape-determining protein MreB
MERDRLWPIDIAVDLGTATTRVAVAHARRPRSVPTSVGAVPALSQGVVVDIDGAAAAIRTALSGLWFRHGGPRVIACAPSDTTPAERAAVIEACRRAGASAVVLMPEPVAAVLGDGVDFESPIPIVLVDIGEGVTDCAVICRGRLTASQARRVGCADLRAAARAAVHAWSGVLVSDQEAMGLVSRAGVGPVVCTPSGLPRLEHVALESGGSVPLGVVREALEPVAERIIETAFSLLWTQESLRKQRTPDLRLSGGGSLIPGFAERITRSVGLPIAPVRRPLDAVVRGAQRVLPLAAAWDLWQRLDPLAFL